MFERLDPSSRETPVYQQLADRVASLIAQGRLEVGDRLPPQRDIARMAGVNLTTVTRAFVKLQERGLVDSRPGRGSIIADPAARAAFKSAPDDKSGYYDLSVTRPATDAYLRHAAEVLPKLMGDPRYHAAQDFHKPEGPLAVREAFAQWFAPAIGHRDAGRIVVTNGAQHALACTLGAIARPGQVVLADSITYQGIRPLCASLDLHLRGVAGDTDGMLPEAFEAACREHSPRAVFLVPNISNPTTVTLGFDRREALASIARRHNVMIIEDDVYRPLLSDPLPTFAERHPDITVYIASLSKCAAPGIRLGMVSAPQTILDDIAAVLRINCWSTGFLTGLVVARLIEEGRLDAIVVEQTEELLARHAILTEILADGSPCCTIGSPHAWLHLPEPWRGTGFTRAADAAGVGVLASEAFAVSRDQTLPHAVRINLSAARSRSDLRVALTVLAGLLKNCMRKVQMDA